MTIDSVLLCLQAVLLGLYGINGVAQTAACKTAQWIAAFISLLGFLIGCIFLESYVKSNIQLLLLFLLVINYILHFGGFKIGNIAKTVIYTGIVFQAYALLYFQLELTEAWLIIPFIVFAIAALLQRRLDILHSYQEYFLKAGVLLTVLFMIDPVVLSIQKNMKPIATIPMSSVVNQQTILLLGVLMGLALGGFLWKEKVRP